MSRKGRIVNHTVVTTIFLVLYCDGICLEPETGVIVCNEVHVITLCTVFMTMWYSSMLGSGQGVVWSVQWGTAALYTESVTIIERIFSCPRIERIRGSRDISPPILNLGSRRR